MKEKFIEQAFFFILLAFGAYLVFQILLPFMPALVLSAIIATVCYPLYLKIKNLLHMKSNGFPALLATLTVFLVVVGPIAFVAYLIFLEAASFYSALTTGRSISIAPTLTMAQDMVDRFLPNAHIDLTLYAEQGAGWVVNSMGTVFTSTATLVLTLFIAFIGLYYLFKDGDRLMKLIIRLSPLPEKADAKIIDRLARSIRSVLVGSLAVGLIQGTLTAIGFTIFGVPQAVLWGMVASLAALIPAVGTSLVLIPTVIFLVIGQSYTSAIGVAIWGTIIVGLVDNFLGPYIMSRGATMHPFLVLVSVLGGLSLFGPVGFILGPVVMSFMIALLEIYETYLSSSSKATK